MDITDRLDYIHKNTRPQGSQGYKPELLGGDFNSDFNNDYKTE